MGGCVLEVGWLDVSSDLATMSPDVLLLSATQHSSTAVESVINSAENIHILRYPCQLIMKFRNCRLLFSPTFNICCPPVFSAQRSVHHSSTTSSFHFSPLSSSQHTSCEQKADSGSDTRTKAPKQLGRSNAKSNPTFHSCCASPQLQSASHLHLQMQQGINPIATSEPLSSTIHCMRLLLFPCGDP